MTSARSKRPASYVKRAGLAALGLAALAGCSREGDLVVDQGVGITAVRSACPAVGIPNHTGDITLFRDDNRRTADGIDVTAVMTNVRTQCSEAEGRGAEGHRPGVQGLQDHHALLRVAEESIGPFGPAAP